MLQKVLQRPCVHAFSMCSFALIATSVSMEYKVLGWRHRYRPPSFPRVETVVGTIKGKIHSMDGLYKLFWLIECAIHLATKRNIMHEGIKENFGLEKKMFVKFFK